MNKFELCREAELLADSESAFSLAKRLILAQDLINSLNEEVAELNYIIDDLTD